MKEVYILHCGSNISLLTNMFTIPVFLLYTQFFKQNKLITESYPLYRRLGGPQGRSGRVRKISPPPGFVSRTVQPVASSYTDWAIPAHYIILVHFYIYYKGFLTKFGQLHFKPFSPTRNKCVHYVHSHI
jgi:hypothetical protein